MKETTCKTLLNSKPDTVAENFKGTQQCKFHSLFMVKLPLSPQGTKLSQDKKIFLPHPTCRSGKMMLKNLKKDRETQTGETEGH